MSHCAFFIDAVPSAGPDGVSANATSSTTIVVRWREVPSIHQNGIIEGYKIVYVGTYTLQLLDTYCMLVYSWLSHSFYESGDIYIKKYRGCPFPLCHYSWSTTVIGEYCGSLPMTRGMLKIISGIFFNISHIMAVFSHDYQFNKC